MLQLVSISCDRNSEKKIHQLTKQYQNVKKMHKILSKYYGKFNDPVDLARWKTYKESTKQRTHEEHGLQGLK